MDDIFTRNFTQEELEYQAIFEAQLKYTANMALHLIQEHKHYTDDCGDYLFAALDLTRDMQAARMDGIDEFVEWMQEQKLKEEYWEQFASDGISDEVATWLGIVEP